MNLFSQQAVHRLYLIASPKHPSETGGKLTVMLLHGMAVDTSPPASTSRASRAILSRANCPAGGGGPALGRDELRFVVAGVELWITVEHEPLNCDGHALVGQV